MGFNLFKKMVSSVINSDEMTAEEKLAAVQLLSNGMNVETRQTASPDDPVPVPDEKLETTNEDNDLMTLPQAMEHFGYVSTGSFYGLAKNHPDLMQVYQMNGQPMVRRSEIEAVLSKRVRGRGKRRQYAQAKPAQSKSAYTRRMYPGRSSERVSISEISQWMTIPRAAKTLGIDPGRIRAMITSEVIDTLRWGSLLCVHVEQVRDYNTKRRRTPTPLSIRAEWQPMTAIAESLQVSLDVLSSAAREGRIASHHIGGSVRLVNVNECAEVFGQWE